MLSVWIILLLCASVSISYAFDNTHPIVQTKLGKIQGSLMNTRLNKTIYAFRGVRFAKAPVGERRFKNPEPVDSWRDIFDATQQGPGCPTPTVEEYDEDCLRLNVYTTKLPSASDKVKRPVIVFFHPGGWYGFSAQSLIFGPQYYLDKDIVLVTVNYRLASLGFLSSGDERAPGNLGLKDQVLSLRWVQKYIAEFGGDPNSVTITGYSAGGTSVALHLMSPMSKGLFHRAIAMSGAPIEPENLPTNQTDILIKQAKFVDCPTDSVDNALQCLKTVPYKKISDTLPKFAEWYGDPVVIWSPVVEPNIPGIERFMPEQPVDLIRKKQFEHVPLIVGMTKDEFASAPLAALEQALNGDETIYKNITDNWEFAAPISFQFERDTPRSKYICRELKKFYFNDKPITVENGRQLGLIYADALIGFPTHRFAQMISEYSDAPVYEYQFAYQGRYSFSPWSNKTAFGVVHHDDMQYLFYMSFGFPFFTSADPESEMVDTMTSMWTNFASSGEPIPKNNDKFKGVKWTKLDPKEDNYLEINEKLTMKKKIYPERYALWDRLFPITPLPTH